ncbi:hypothetical protein GCM10009549_26170 [Streptomyces thermoalcalitolerans]|uniref:CRISPR-associated protein Cst1 n=1 Tax=Streptomyces thermoalcalitolerans TaxID=65605 RepID=A0ABN1NN37_9ACTN
MDTVSATAVVPSVVTATGHPLQCAGAWAVAVLARRSRPEEVTAADLDRVVAVVVEDAVRAAIAEKGTAAYDWWKVLFALYPNSKATHSKRPRDAAVLREALTALFAPDAVGSSAGGWPCTFCGARAGAVWTKSTLPMFDTNMALNTLPPNVPGWPVCRGCRVAAWALPYGAWVTAGSVTVLICEAPGVEREFVARNVREARRIMQLGFGARRSGARPELSAVRAVRALRSAVPAAATLWTFKNDNQDPWLRVVRTRQSLARFLAVVDGNAEPRRGWRLLELSLTKRGRDGRVETSGPDEAARLLFESDDGRGRSLLRHLHHLLHPREDSWNERDRAALTRLAFTYAEEILGMNPHLEPVATLVADWIEHGSGEPRGRLAEYRRVALNDYHLGHLLNRAQFRLMLDGRPVAAGPEDWRPFIERRPRAWEHRMLLAARVIQLLQERDVKVSDAAGSADEETERLVEQPILEPADGDFGDEMGEM